MTKDTTTTSGAADLPEARLFTKKPVTIAALQWTGKNLREVITFTDGPPDTRTTHAGMAWEAYADLVARDGLKIYTLEGKMLASPGDWIIRGVKGEYYPCKPDIFEATYSPAALAAGQATAAQAVVPAGWNLVPTEPTQAMLDAVVTSMDDFLLGKEAEKQYREDWAAMLAAATAQPVAEQGVASAALPDEREAFEAMMRSQTFDSLKRLSDGSYESYEARVGWLAWNVRASHGRAPAGATLPDGWVPLTITLEGQFSEEVAYGPQIMMDRLGKWLGKYFAQAAQADSVQEDAARLERERICAAIKAEDDYCVDNGDYMLDSDDCIKIVRGEWVRPAFSADAARKQGATT